ncbi:cytochrome P450 [Candidatus Poriferisodalis sp.]|uniref:cytochrome P450 n=1 Tax=Candidatus Poriferisodalis sp. TaxID=3101277 RepID=UPI003AF4ADCA
MLLLDNDCGRIRTLPGQANDFGFAAGVLLELARRNRIDPGSDPLCVIDDRPIGNEVPDLVLDRIRDAEQPHSAEWWVRHLGADFGSRIADASLSDLVESGIVERVPGDLFFLASDVELTRRCPSEATGSGADDVSVRVMRALLLGEKPETDDATLIQLVESCGLFDCILDAPERERARRSVGQLGSLHPLCQAVARLVAAGSSPPRPDSAPCKPIPDVPGLPFLGNAIGLAGEIGPYLNALYRVHGPICRVRIPGKSIVVLSGKEGVEFARKHSQTHLRNDVAFAPMCRAAQSDRLLIATGGHDHIKLRRIAHEIASAMSVEANLPKLIAVARDLLSDWQQDKSVSAYAAMQRMSIMQVGHVAFDKSVAPYVDSVRYWNDTLIISMRGDRPYFMVERRLRKVRRDIQRLFHESLEEHDPDLRSGRPRDLLDRLLEMQRRQPEFISVPDLMAAVINPYFQSSDQIACTLGLAVLYLLADQRLAERCRAEADEAFSSGTLSADGLKGLELTRAVIAEVLRLHAQAPIMQRTARISFEFEGHWVPAGSPMWVAAAVVHGDPENYDEPDVFEPDRHLPPRLESQREGAYAAFGAGAHSCIGEQFASDLMALNLATMMCFAEIDRLPSGDRRVRITSYPLIRPHTKCRIQIKSLRDADGNLTGVGTAPLSQLHP